MGIEHSFTRTKAEQKMAKALTKQRVHFEQNYLLEGYEVDFWIEEAGLVVEVDGFFHLSNRKLNSDWAKDRKLHEKGYIVIRFDNQQVYNSLAQCVKEIKMLIIKIKSCRMVNSSINSTWKNELKPLKQKIKFLEAKEKSQPNIEAYFLSLDQETD